MNRAFAIAILGLLATVVRVSFASAGTPAPSRWCLPPESGQRLKTVVESADVRSVLKEAFRLDRADIVGSGIELEIENDAGDFARARLEPAQPNPEAGRWFALASMESSSRKATAILEDTARRIEVGFGDNPFVHCHRQGLHRQHLHPQYLSESVGRWWYLSCGAAQWLLIAIGLAVAFRRPPD